MATITQINHEKKLAWITGAGGLIGSHLCLAAGAFAPEWQVLPLTRTDVDLTEFESMRRKFLGEKPDLVIHCAALTQTAACQQNPSLAWKINFEVTQFLSELAANIPFFFFSTDLVFDGKKGNYVENDLVNPLLVYAETKVVAEQVVLANPKHTVLRTSITYGTSPQGNRSFNESIHLAWKAGQVVRFFTDEFRCPLPAAVTARAVWELAAQNRPGLYHLAGSERLSRWEIGQLLAAQAPSGLARLEPASLREHTGMPRPADTSLNCEKIQQLLSFRLPGLSEWIEKSPGNSMMA